MPVIKFLIFIFSRDESDQKKTARKKFRERGAAAAKANAVDEAK